MADKVDARFEQLYEKLKGLSEEDRERVREAYNYARAFHDGQFRKDGSPYITHPLEVAFLVGEKVLAISS